MNPPVTDVQTITLLLEKGGLPGLVLVGIYLVWRFAPDRKSPEPAQQVVTALNDLRDELADLREQTIDRLARVETEVKNLKERK